MNQLRTLVGKRIQVFRRHLGFTQEQLAERAGLSLKHLGEIERGKGNPALSSLESLAGALEVSVVQLFGYECENLPPDKVRLELDLMIKTSSDEMCRKYLRILKTFAEEG